MADLDKDLSLKIVADANEADQAIDGLIRRLRSLNDSLVLGNLNNFSRQLQQIAISANSLSSIGKDINAISSAGSKLSSLTGFKTLNEQMMEVSATSQKLAQDVGKVWQFEAAKGGKKNVQEFGKAIEATMKAAARTGNTSVISEQAQMWGDIIAESSNSVMDINAEADAFADLAAWAKKTTLYLDESTKSWLKYSGALDLVRSTFKGITSSNLKGSSIEELGEDLQKFGFQNADSNPQETILAVAKAIDQYNTALKYSVVKGRDQISAGLVSEKDFQDAGLALANNVEKAFGQIFSEEGTKKDLFGSLLPSLTELSGITIPDFSGLTVLADALNSLQKVNAGKISAVANAVNKFNSGKGASVDTSALEAATRVFSGMADTISGQVTPAVDGAKQHIDFIVDEMGNVQSTVETSRSLFDQIGTSLAVIGENSTALRTNFEEANTEVAVFVDEVQDAVDKMELMTQRSVVTDDDPLGMYKSLAKVKEVLDDVENDIVDGEIKDEMYVYDAAMEKASQSADKAADSSKKQKSANIDLLASLVALGHELQNVASIFSKWGDSGVKLLKAVFSPLNLAFSDFKAKIKGISDSMKNLRANMQKHLTKMSAFWKRAMKTFTFMLVRKAITAILTETKTAIDSLAMWSNQFGTAFNGSMSEIVANASYLARNLIAMFEPIINFIVPILNTLVEALARAARAVAEFFAAFTGQDYFMVAKKKVGNYTDSLNKANKAQKNLTMGIDELNILSENQSGGSDNPLGGFADEWDTAPVSDKMKKLAEDLKGILEKLFAPLKKAWDLAGDYVIDGFNWMKRQLGDLFKSIGRDFLEVWNQPETVEMLANILRIVGDIEFTIGNLAYKFRQAWEEGEKGKHIFEAIRDIMAILIQHVRNVTLYMRQWSQGIDFNPLLEKTLELLNKMKPLAEFIGGVFEDIMKNVVLKYIEFLIEEGIPHLMDTIGLILDSFDFEKLRQQLVPLEEAFEGMLENIDTGITDAIGYIGQAVGEFTQSEDFQKFLNNVAWFMDQITADRVKKLFTILGDAILKVSESVIKFAGSEKFKDFLDKLFKWFDNADADKLSDTLIKIAGAIAAFKFAGFVGKGLSGFTSFLSAVSAAKNVAGILGGIGASASTILPLAGIFAAVAVAAKSFVDSFGGIQGAADRLKQTFSNIGGFITELGEKFNISDKVNALKDAFVHLNGSLGNMKDFWNIILAIFEEVARQVSLVVVPIFAALVDAVTGLIEIFDGFIQILGGLSSVIVGICTGDFPKIKEGVQGIIDGVNTVMAGFYDALVKPVIDAVQGVIEWFAYLFDVLLGHSIIPDIVDGIIDGFTSMVTDVINTVKGLVNKVVGFFKDLWNKVVSVATKIKEEVVGRWNALVEGVKAIVTILVTWVIGKWNELKQKVVETVTQLKDNIIQKWNEIKSNVEEKVRLIKEYIIEKWNEIKAKAEELWNKIKEKIITPIQEAWDKLFGAEGLIATMVSKAKTAWEDIKKDVIEILGKVKDAIIAPFKDAWDALFGENGWITGLVNKVKTAFEGISGDEITKLLKGVADAIVQPFKDAYDKAMGEDGWVTKLLKGIDDFFNGIKKAIEDSPLGKFFQNIADKIDKLKEKLGGLKDDAKEAESATRSSSSVQGYFNGGFVQYATGGYPSRGTLFWAGEYGMPEMLGTVGGRTAVASSAEITGIKAAVDNSSIQEQNMMSQMINLLQVIAAKDTSVNLDSRELVSSLNDRARRNGFNFQMA